MSVDNPIDWSGEGTGYWNRVRQNPYVYIQDGEEVSCFTINPKSERECQLDRAYMDVAKIFAGLSRAERLKVGAVLVKDRQILTEGYNGTPSGLDNTMEIDGVTSEYAIHAEQNILMKMAKNTTSSVGSTLYVTHSPCATCAKLLYQAGIVRVVYEQEYRDTAPLEFLRDAGVQVEKLS